MVGGLLLRLVRPEQVGHAVKLVTQHELSEDPNDWFAIHLVSLAGKFSIHAKTFMVLYLLSHGILKMALVGALLRRKLWAYPAAMGIFALFGVYQVYRYCLSPSALMILLTVSDSLIIWLTWREYRQLRRTAG